MNIQIPRLVLIVDDEERNRVLLRDFLTTMGFASVEAQNGPEALLLVRTKSPDVVLLDLMMPVMDGAEVLRRIKADSQSRHIPVIVVSAFDDRERIDSCITQGADDYLVKPFDVERLKARLTGVLLRVTHNKDDRELKEQLEQLLFVDQTPVKAPSSNRTSNEEPKPEGRAEGDLALLNSSYRISPPKRQRGAKWVAASIVMVLSIGCGIIVIAARWRTEASNSSLTPKQVTIADSSRDSGDTRSIVDAATGSMLFFGVAIGNYRDESKHLACPVTDVRAISDGLKAISTRSHAGKELYSSFDQTVLLDEDATKINILNQLRLFTRRRDLDQGDVAFFWFAGHGELDKLKSEEDRFIFAPVDFDWSQANPGASGVSWRDILFEIRNLPCKTIIVMDTCHSGRIISDIDQRGSETSFDAALDRSIQEHSFSPVGTFAIAASMPQLPAEESKAKWGHSALAKAILEVFEGHISTDGTEGPRVITIGDLQKYVPERVKELTDANQSVLHRGSHNVDFQVIALGISGTENGANTTEK